MRIIFRKNSLLSAVMLLGLTGQLARAAPPTLCKQGETTYFSCQLKGSRVVSVCGSGAVEASENQAHRASWLQYRIGTPKALELVFPKQKENSVSKFEGVSRQGGGVRINSLDFEIGDVAYSVENSYSELTKEGYTGVKVVVDRKETSFPCRGDAALDSEFEMISQELDSLQK
jgi:hypothetical protein